MILYSVYLGSENKCQSLTSSKKVDCQLVLETVGPNPDTNIYHIIYIIYIYIY